MSDEITPLDATAATGAAPVEAVPAAEAAPVEAVPAADPAPVEAVPADVIPEPPAESPNKTYTSAGVADIVFLIDITGSMGPCIEALRNNINQFIAMLTDTTGNGSPVTDWRARVVGYRDYLYDGPTSYGWLVDLPFTRDVNVLRSQLSGLEPKGGGPGQEGIPESLLDAMMTVAAAGTIDLQAGDSEENTAKWRPSDSCARIIIVFTDATYHPTMSIPGYEGAGLRELNNVYKQERIKPYLFVPSDPSFVALGRFKNAILTQCGEGSDGLISMTSNAENFNKLLIDLAKGVSKSATVRKKL